MTDVLPPAGSAPSDPESRPALVVSRRVAKRIGIVAAVFAVAGIVIVAFFLGKASSSTRVALARSRTSAHHVRDSQPGAPESKTATVPPPTTTTTTVVPPPTTTTTSLPPTTTTTTVPALPVLPPATVPPVVGECSQQLTFDADGNASPLLCQNGEINVIAWRYYAQGNSSVMSLGPNATPSQVFSALCAGAYTSSYPIQDNVYILSAAYYGWNFSINPTTNLNGGTCP